MLQKGFTVANMELTSCSPVADYPNFLSHAARKSLKKALEMVLRLSKQTTSNRFIIFCARIEKNSTRFQRIH